MARWIGIDYGKKRVGIACTDPLALISSPLNTIAPKEVIPFLHAYRKDKVVDGIVIGLPRDLYNCENEMTLLVKRFTRLLHRHIPDVPLYHHDERFTSILAQRSLIEANIKKKKRQDKKLLDAISASFILRSFLVLHTQGKSRSLTHPADRTLAS